MHWQYKYTFANSIEYEYKYAGKYGAKGEKREKKKKATPEQVKKQNQRNRENHMRRIIKANFFPNDLWITLKYPAGTRLLVDIVKNDMTKFCNNMRDAYKRLKYIFKFVRRMEIGKKGGIHIHILINRIPNVDLLVNKYWKNGYVNFTSLYEEGGYEKLASYIVKQPDEEIEKQLSLFPEEDQKELIKYSRSRNLLIPEPEKKTYTRRTVKKLVEEGPEPTKGFYIDKNSIQTGVNQFTGMSYFYYTEVRIQPRERGEVEKEKNGKI